MVHLQQKETGQARKIALKTPGEAKRLRENFGDVLDCILQNEDHKILFERSYDESVRIGNSIGQELFMHYSGSSGIELRVFCLLGSSVIKEWSFKKETSSMEIVKEISEYFV